MKDLTIQTYSLNRVTISTFMSFFILSGCNGGGASDSDSASNLSTSVQSELRTIEITDTSLRWYEDNNLGVHGDVPLDFHSRMATPEDWEQALKIMDVFYLRSATYKNHMSSNPALVQELALLLDKYNISLAIDEVAATWAHSGKANRDTEFTETLTMLDDLTQAGFSIRYISLQSVLSKPLQNSDGDIVDYPYEKRYLDISGYISKISELYPDIEFGIMDALPAKVTKPEYESVYQGLFDYLAEKNLHLDYLHLDFPINLINQEGNQLTINTVKQVRQFVTDTFNWRFGWIVTDRDGGINDPSGFAQAIDEGLSAYLNIGGEADDYILSAWFPYPQFTIPDEYSSAMPAFATFRMMDQILNVAGNGNKKACSFEITGEIEKNQSLDYVTYKTLQEAPVIYQLYCDPHQSITLADGITAKATKPIYQCIDEQKGQLYFSAVDDCNKQPTTTPTIIGYLFPHRLPKTTPFYQCQFFNGTVTDNCPDDSTTNHEPLGYY